MSLIFLASILLTANPANPVADGPAIQVAVRECTQYSCSKFQYGSGMITQRKNSGVYVVITNRHVLEMERPNPRATKTAYVLIKGEWIVAKEGGKSPKVDLALLTFTYAGKLGVMPIGATAPAEGSDVDLYSFRRRGALMHQSAKIQDRSSTGGNLKFSDYLTANIQDGQSGGGVIQNGELVGLIFARDSRPRGFLGILKGAKYSHMGICVDHESLKEFALKEGYKFEAAGEWTEAKPKAEEKPKKFTRKPKPKATEPAIEKPAPVIVKPNGEVKKIGDKLSKLSKIVSGMQTTNDDKPKPSPSFLKRAVIFAGTTAGLSVAGASGVGTAATIALWLYRRRKKRKGKKSGFDVSKLSIFNRRGFRTFPFGVRRHGTRTYPDPPIDPLLVPPANDTECTRKPDPPVVERVPITVQTPPTVNVQTENVYVPVERDTYREAVKYAHAQLARRYPSAEGSIAFIDGMVERYLSGQHLKG